MRPDQSWMLRRKDRFGVVSEEFRNGVEGLIQVATRDPTIAYVSGRIPCPCAKCRNRYREKSFWVEKHLHDHRFVNGYVNWTLYGEERWRDGASMSVIEDCVEDNRNPYVDIVMDVVCDRLQPQSKEVEENPNSSASKYYNLLSDADEPLWHHYYYNHC